MNFSVLTPDQSAEWSQAVDMLPANLRDIHFSHQYAAAQVHLGVKPRLAVYRWNDYVVLQPFALREFSVGGIAGMDIANLYGYGGPASNHGATLFQWFSQAFDDWCRSQGIVSEFCQLNPMLNSHQRKLVRQVVKATERKVVVVADISETNAKWRYKDRRQAGIRTASRLGITVNLEHDPAAFIRLYRQTMQRVYAPERFDFSDEYLRALAALGYVFCARFKDVAESAALMLHAGPTAYYHLAGNAMLNPKSGANDLLVHEMMIFARNELGARWFHLGGGVTSEPNDPVLHFKAGYSDMRLPAYAYFRVLDEMRYKELCAAKIAEEKAVTGAEFTSEFLPMYRREAS